MPGFRDNFSPITSLYRVPGLCDTIALKRQCVVCQIYVTIFTIKRLWTVCLVSMTKLPSKCLCRVPDLRDNISPIMSLYRVPGLRDTIALKRLCAGT